MALPVFPLSPLTHPAFPVHRRPTFATTTQVGKQGRETGFAQQIVALWEFELTYEGIRDRTQNIIQTSDISMSTKVELQRLLQLFLATASQFGDFLFNDWTDNSREDQFIGSGDGVRTQFPFIRLIAGESGVVYTEAVGAVNENFGVIVSVDGTPIAPGPSTWGISTDQRTLVFVTPPAFNALITSTFHYYYRCRWISDYQEIEEFANHFWEAKSVRFRSVYREDPYVPPQPIEPINPPNPPTPELSNCLKDFQWWNRTPIQTRLIIPTVGGPPATFPGGRSLDKNGLFYVYEGDLNPSISHGKLDIFAADGTVVASHSQKDLADAIDVWFGSSIVVRNGSGSDPSTTNGFPVKPIMDGNYLMAYLGATPSPTHIGFFSNWWAVLDPQLDGSLSVLGACYYISGLGPPYGSVFNMLEPANDQTTSDPLLFLGTFLVGGFTTTVGVLPSIDDMSGAVGSYPDFPQRIPPTVLYPLGGADLSQRLLVGSVGGHGNWGGFVVPNDDGDTILYIYLNRGYMDQCAGNSLALACKEVKEVIQPVHPHGAMLKINLGVLDFDVLSSTPLVDHPQWFGDATAAYSVDNANWVAASFPQIPFSDEYTYISLGNNPGGTDVYEMSPGAVVKRPSGKWWIIFYMVGAQDALVNDPSGQTLETFRIFEWNPATQIGTQIVKDSCLLHTNNNVQLQNPASMVNRQQDYFQTFEIVDELDGSVTLIIHSMVYLDNFYNFTP